MSNIIVSATAWFSEGDFLAFFIIESSCIVACFSNIALDESISISSGVFVFCLSTLSSFRVHFSILAELLIRGIFIQVSSIALRVEGSASIIKAS